MYDVSVYMHINVCMMHICAYMQVYCLECVYVQWACVHMCVYDVYVCMHA